jgi:hypothetical protein
MRLAVLIAYIHHPLLLLLPLLQTILGLGLGLVLGLGLLQVILGLGLGLLIK